MDDSKLVPYYDKTQIKVIKKAIDHDPKPGTFLLMLFYKDIENKKLFTGDHAKILEKLYRKKRQKHHYVFDDIIRHIENILDHFYPDNASNYRFFYESLHNIYVHHEPKKDFDWVYDKIIQLKPSSLDYYEPKINTLVQKKDYKSLIGLMGGFLRYAQADAYTKKSISLKLYQLALDSMNRDPETALLLLSEASLIDPDFDIWYLTGQIYRLYFNDVEKGLLFMAKAYEAGGEKKYLACESIAELCDQKGHMEEAIHYYSEAIFNTPKDKSPMASLINLSDCLIRHGRLEEGLVVAEKGLQLNNGEPLLWHTKAEALYKLEKHPLAKTCAKKAVELYEQHFKKIGGKQKADYFNLMEVLWLAREEEKLKNTLKRFLEKFPEAREECRNDQRYYLYVKGDA